MKIIQRNAFIYNLFFDKNLHHEKITEQTPTFKNIHLGNLPGYNINGAGLIRSIEDMPVLNVSFPNINMKCKTRFNARVVKNIRFNNVDFPATAGASFAFVNYNEITLDNVMSSSLVKEPAVLEITVSIKVLVTNCYSFGIMDLFLPSKNSEVIYENSNLTSKSCKKQCGSNLKKYFLSI